MLEALRTLYSSKKFQTLIIGLMVTAGARFGLALDPELCIAILAAFGVLIHAQGQADHGKEAAKINAAADPLAPAQPLSGGSGNTVVMLALVIGLGGLLAAAPACGASSQQAHLRDAMTGLSVASDAFVAFDRAHQQTLVDKATSLADGTARLDAYKSKRGRVVDLFAAAYHAIAAAAVLDKPDSTSVTNALLAAQLALDAWNDLKEASP